MKLIKLLQDSKLFSEEECINIDKAFSTEEFPKGMTVQQSKGHTVPLLFIESGLIRTYFVLEGKDVTHFYVDENDFIASLDEIFNDQPGRYEWEVVEPCVVRSINYDDFLKLEQEYPRLARILLNYTMKQLHIFSQKINMLQFQSASDRYKLFLEMFPNLNNRVPLGSIASFIGVTQQTLSVVRSQ